MTQITLYLKNNKHVEAETVAGIFPDENKFSILSAERLTSFRFDKIFDADIEEIDQTYI